MFDASHLHLDSEGLLAAGYLFMCQVLKLSVLLLSLLKRWNERAHILRLEAKLLAALIQANAYVTRNFTRNFADHGAFESIVLRLVLQPFHQYSAAQRIP